MSHSVRSASQNYGATHQKKMISKKLKLVSQAEVGKTFKLPS